MTNEKFEIEINTLKKFYEVYCKNKHENLVKRKQILKFKNSEFPIELELCEECHEWINYSFERLQECPHETKPRCRNCPTPCYEKTRWKNTAKVMKYAAITLSLSKVKNKVRSLFS